MALMASPPQLLYGVIGGAVTVAENNSTERSHSSSSSSSSIENVKPSIIIIILILSTTVLVSVSLCILLRHLNRRCLGHLSRSSTSTMAAASSHRVSPEQSMTASLLDSLPLFTFSSITRRCNNDSTVSGDCAVCLSKFEPQDQLRLLPLCCHAFHAHCIDTWLTSNQTCPLCRSPLFASEADLMKVLIQSSNAGGEIGSGGDSFRLEIGSISHRQPGSDPGEQRRSYSVGSFDYIVEEESELTRNQTHRRNMSDKEEVGGAEATSEASLAAEVANGRSWLKEYVDRLSFSLSSSSRALSFRSSGRFFTGSSRRSDISGAAGDYDVESNRIGEDISEMFRWFSGV